MIGYVKLTCIGLDSWIYLQCQWGSNYRCKIFAIYSPILSLMFGGPTIGGVHPFVLVCKECLRNIPAPVETLPDSWIITDCPLCGAKRRYLPSDIFQGRLSTIFPQSPKGLQIGGDTWGR